MTKDEPYIKDPAAMRRRAEQWRDNAGFVHELALANDVLLCLERIEWLERELKRAKEGKAT